MCTNSDRQELYTSQESNDIVSFYRQKALETFLRIGSLRDTDIKFCRHKKIIWTSYSANTLGMTFTSNNSQENIKKKHRTKTEKFNKLS